MHRIKRALPVAIIGSPDLYRAVRAGFVAQGTTLNKWCIAKGVNRQTVDKALKGERRSKRSQAIIDELIAAALEVEEGQL